MVCSLESPSRALSAEVRLEKVCRLFETHASQFRDRNHWGSLTGVHDSAAGTHSSLQASAYDEVGVATLTCESR